jgi:hypothetical protein
VSLSCNQLFFALSCRRISRPAYLAFRSSRPAPPVLQPPSPWPRPGRSPRGRRTQSSTASIDRPDLGKVETVVFPRCATGIQSSAVGPRSRATEARNALPSPSISDANLRVINELLAGTAEKILCLPFFRGKVQFLFGNSEGDPSVLNALDNVSSILSPSDATMLEHIMNTGGWEELFLRRPAPGAPPDLVSFLGAPGVA